MRSRRVIRNIASIMLGAMLFAQAALAAAACDWLSRAPAQAVAEQADAATCHEEPSRNANLCLAHCLSADQSLDKPVASIAALPPAPLLAVLPVNEPEARLAPRKRHIDPHAAAPPRIRFQTLLL